MTGRRLHVILDRSPTVSRRRPAPLALAASARGRARALAGAAGLLTVSSFLITRFGNVPINARIKQWAATAPPPDHAEVLRRWELFNDARTATTAVAFGLLILVSLTGQRGLCRQEPKETR
ncbi:anthrone oxygenase family protein [Streptomyces sp. NPDC004227]